MNKRSVPAGVDVKENSIYDRSIYEGCSITRKKCHVVYEVLVITKMAQILHRI